MSKFEDPGNMAKKHNYHIGGFEAPRNSIELPVESIQSCYTAREYEPYSYAVRQNMSKSSSFSANASMKKLISDEISKGSNHKQRGPSIVARLMGMDMFPSDTDSIAQPDELKDDSAGISSSLQKHYREKISKGCDHKKSSGDKNLHSSDKHMYTHFLSNGTNLGKKPRHRLHPQEKELQQFKKDFEAWQASRFLECAKVADLGNIPDQWLSQLDMTKEKTVAYENTRKSVGYKKSSFSPKHKKSYGFRTKSMDREFEEFSMMDFEKRSKRSYSPARIVILKPGPESFSSNDESWASSSGSLDDRDCIEDLLEEVREKLKSETQGKKFRSGCMIRGGGIETPFKERSSHTNQRARDLARKLLRSDSTRSYRSETDDSPELHRQNHYIPNIINCSSKRIEVDDTRGRLEQVRNILNAKNGWENWNGSNNGDYYAEATTSKHEFDEEETFEEELLSPRNLVRSLSAPVSGTSFGKLLLEDRHILTGAHVRRKHESLENVGMDGKNRKKERFKIKEKVSNIKYNFTLKGKLFSRKFHSFDLSQSNEYEFIKDINSGPTVLLNLPDRIENYTEVPPSPASICSSTHEDHLSQILTSDITSVEDQTVDNACREISSNLNELKRGYEESEVTTITEEALETQVVDLEDQSKEAYIRDLLVTSGLYNGHSSNSFPSWDPYEKLIDDKVFEKVEESYTKPNNEASFNHKMLFDLLNEALSVVLKPPKAFSRFRRNTISSTLTRPPQGRTLLQKVWTIIHQHIYTSSEDSENTFPSLEDMVSHDLGYVPWFDLIDEELKVVGSHLEAQITSELIEEVIKEQVLSSLHFSVFSR